MRTKVILSIIGVLLLLLIGWWVQWFYANHEQKTREIKTDISPLAKRNPLLAADLFLRRIGRQSESVSGRDFLLNPPEGKGLLVVNRLGGSLPAERQEALLDWVRRGSHLIISPPSGWTEEAGQNNSLFDFLGVEVYQQNGPDNEEEASESAGISEIDQQVKLSPIVFEMPAFDGEMTVAFTDQLALFDSLGHADWQVESDEGAHLLQFEMGRGKITVLGDQDFFSNDRIGEHDHALFLARLAADSPRTWLLYSSDMPSLLQLLWRHATELVVSLLLLLLMFVWFLTQRSGPIRGGAHLQRRNLMEHLAAVGHYIWRTDQAEKTFRRSQVALEQRWVGRHPLLNGMPQDERCQWIADHVGLTPEAVEWALYGSIQGEHEFIKVSAIQQKLIAQLYNQQGLSAQGER